MPLGQRQPLPTLATTLGAAAGAPRPSHPRRLLHRGRAPLALPRQGLRLRARRPRRPRRRRPDRGRRARDRRPRRARERPGLRVGPLLRRPRALPGRGSDQQARYDDAVRRVDRGVGALVAHARRALHGPVVVVLTADHGEEFGEHGGVYHGSTLYEEQVRVPLVIAAPGVAHRVVREPVALVDVAPTLAGLVGAPRPASMQGRDLRAAMIGDADPSRAVFAAVNTRRMVTRGRFKLVVDLALGVEELYDLAADPRERRNRAGDGMAQRPSLRADLAAWMESLAARAGGAGPLSRGRMGDRSAAPALAALALDARARGRDRVEALTLLADLGATEAAPALRPLLRDGDRAVADAAAVALGLAGDRSGVERLRRRAAGDPFTARWRAARALAAVGDPAGLDALCEGLHRDEPVALESLKSLTALGDPRAIEALLAVYADVHLRYRVVLALGATRDPRAFTVLRDAALGDPTDDVRANATAALGRLGDPRAVPVLAAMLRRDRAERYAAEALGALGALGRAVDGWDARGATPDGWTCGAHDDETGWRYLGARSCVSPRGGGAIDLTVTRGGERRVVIRARRDAGPETRATLRVDGREVARFALSPRWDEPRLAVTLSPGPRRFEVVTDDRAARVSVDHVAVVDPR
ncbi:MAG: HEAT repeat domain-containing protein [Polyangiales bacterium]